MMGKYLLAVISRLRTMTLINCLVVLISGVSLLVIYYGYIYSLPTASSGVWWWFDGVVLFEFRYNMLGVIILVPIIYASLTLGWMRAAVFQVALLVGIGPYILYLSNWMVTMITSFIVLVCPPLLVASIEIKLNADAEQRKAHEERNRQRDEIFGALIRAQEEERRRISLELHDGVSQSLLATATVAHGLLRARSPLDEGVRLGLQSIKDSILGIAEEIRRVCQDLRPSVLENLGFVSAMKWLIEGLRKDMGIAVELVIRGEPYELGSEEEAVLFRIAQEAFNNIKKHSEASLVRVSVAFSSRSFTMDIYDNGVGLGSGENPSAAARGGGLGVAGMKERACAIGATFRIFSGKTGGTQVSVSSDRWAGGTESRRTRRRCWYEERRMARALRRHRSTRPLADDDRY